MERCRHLSSLFAFALLTLYALFLPLGGYERMMEAKYHLFLFLTLGYLASMTHAGAWRAVRFRAPMVLSALGYLALSALSAALSPYGSAVLLGGPRRDGLVTVTLYVLTFLLLARFLRPDRRMLYAAACSAAACDVLVLVQLAGYNPFWLYPDALSYWDGDIAYAGFYAGTAGNIDFTAFLLALCAAAMAAALVRGWNRWLLFPLALTLWTLARLQVASSLTGLFAAAALSLPLLFPRRRGTMCALTLLLFAAALAFLWGYGGDSPVLLEAHRLLHGEADGSFGSGRLAIYRALVPLIRERPLLGGGCGTLYLRDIAPFLQYFDGKLVQVAITSAHCEYLGVLVDQGLAALLCHLALSALALSRCFRRAARDGYAVVGAALLCYLAMSLFSVSTCITGVFFYLLLALAAGGEAENGG